MPDATATMASLPAAILLVVAQKYVAAGATGGESEGANAAEAAIPETTLCELSEDERVREIARMLSGDANEASLAHAKEMLKNAR